MTHRRRTVWLSAIALKIAMALTGLFFILFVVVHLYGNLKVFEGQDSFDTYTHHLRVLGEPILPYRGFLTVARAVLVSALVIHATCAVILWRRARRARPVAYEACPKRSSSASSRSMRWGGITVLAYLLFHLANLTTLWIKTYPDTDSAYERLIATFQPEHWWVVLIYLAAQVPLGLHIRHGLFSAMQTLGFTSTIRRRALASNAGFATAVVVSLGFASIPIAIMAGIVR